MRRQLLVLLFAAALIGCRRSAPPTLDTLAKRYVKLVLAAGAHNADAVDMFYGPSTWQRDAATRRTPIAELRRGAAELVGDMRNRSPATDSELERRLQYLMIESNALRHLLDRLPGTPLRFDEESRDLYGLIAPAADDASFAADVDALDGVLPGVGPMSARLERFSTALAVPSNRIPTVLDAALTACRERTTEHLALPDTEHVELAYVRDRPWSAYAHYQGAFRTRIEVNIDLPMRPDQALDLMCHEGYPGHHTQYTLLEARFVRQRGWIEYQIAAMFSPAAALAEGAATAAVGLAFPQAEREAFERNQLFPLAGLPSSGVSTVEQVRAITNRLSRAGTEAARRYLDGRMDRPSTISWLERYGAMPRATDLLAFVDRYRSYVVGYTVATSAVQAYIERGARWKRYEDVIMDPAGAGWLQGMSMK